MRIFEEDVQRPPRRDADWEQHRNARFPHAGPAQDELGVLAQSGFLLARNAEVAVGVRGITAYSDGLVLHVAVLFVDEQKQQQLEWSLHEHSRSPGRFRLGVEMPDGTRTTSGPGDAPVVEAPDQGPVLTLQKSADSVLRWDADYWLWPLPTRGNLLLGCWWPDRRIEESLVVVDTSALVHAAETSEPVWKL
jgi:hypothetical protein